MYLKSIEIHGFKSFANKIVLDFHDGITGIVGPNGSGKSNIADAMRWVLGEQSAKSLRGSNMQDFIFSGTETRKPMGFAYVAITMDNYDHKLPIDFEEVTVARRVYRSGESEYLINNSACRLRDVQELFMDTGVGKEGYSIIGQGQIDKVLSGKPEDRRELFDEAAGIVKFKKRKAIAEKNLEEEKLNLSRVNDIIAEIEHRIGPLEQQSATAKEYLKLKEELKTVEIDQFFIEYESNKKQKDDFTSRLSSVSEDLDDAKNSYAGVKEEYENLTERLKECDLKLSEYREEKSALEVLAEKLKGEILLLNEQLAGISQNRENFRERIDTAKKAVEEKQKELEVQAAKLSETNEKLERLNDAKQEMIDEIRSITEAISAREKSMENLNKDVFGFINSNSDIKTEIQRLKTLKEQTQIAKAEVNSAILKNKSDEALIDKEIAVREEKLKEAVKNTADISEEIEALAGKITDEREKKAKNEEELNDLNTKISALESRIDALKDIAERYEGYGSSIRKVMQQKDSVKGIHGVVADLISVEKKYETAVETALGGNIQNIVTDDEDTAKKLIDFLKTNKLGRATFLPITGINEAMREKDEDLSGEKGVIAYASDLVETEKIYENVVKYLIGRILVVDTFENAVKLQKKHKYGLRIVTVEGEYLTPGGSISGGSFKNNTNLLGRRREIEEREETRDKMLKRRESLTQDISDSAETLKALRKCDEELRSKLSDCFVLQNTAKMNLNQEQSKKNEIADEYTQLTVKLGTFEEKLAELDKETADKNNELEENDRRSLENKKRIEEYTGLLRKEEDYKKDLMERATSINVETANLTGASSQMDENLKRAESELKKLSDDLEHIVSSAADFEEQETLRKQDCEKKRIQSEDCAKHAAALAEEIEALETEKDEINKKNGSIFKKSEELMNLMGSLEKEKYRLEGNIEKLSAYLDSSVTYLWEEYELTPTSAESLRSEAPGSATANRRRISELKNGIKDLGNVNVNAIEEYKETAERYEFLTKQKNDIKLAEEKLQNIIAELDADMRRQFTEEFAKIAAQFDVVFKELFGGGKGTLELTEEEDVLEAGIKINAQPPGKKLQNMMQLSGGEKALTAISLLFAIQNLKPSPFCLLDEIEAALDDSNVKRFAKYLEKLKAETQFIVITHRRGTMSSADRLYGITMQEKGVSTQVSVNLIDGQLDK
ncbi:MAG: chromosome segregation protein SMC [Lachnospiraceae bacterium]|nr:chromosome segregation protein SMC [Lachnospiraceae bacterium]